MAVGTTNFPASLDDADSLVRVANSASTTLATTINSTDTSIVLTDASLFPSSGIISIESEIIAYSSKSSNTLTVQASGRGFEGTTAASHTSGVAVKLLVTAKHHSVLVDAIVAIQAKIGAGNPITRTLTSLGTTITDAYVAANSTAAAAGAQQVSPAIVWEGLGWSTTNSASRSVRFAGYVLPIQGSTNPTGEWVIASNVNAGGYTRRFSVNTAGVCYANGYHFDVSGFGRGCGLDIIDDTSFQWTINGSLRGVFSGNNLQLYTSAGQLQAGAPPDVAIGRKAAGLWEINNCTAIGTTPGNARDLMLRRSFLIEASADPSAADLTVAGGNAKDTVAAYMKNDKLVFAYNNSGTVTYVSIPLDGSTATWTHSTSAP